MKIMQISALLLSIASLPISTWAMLTARRGARQAQERLRRCQEQDH
jgi:hypothetical protein